MSIQTSINVREATAKDVPRIVEYWAGANDDFLVGMGVDLSKIPTRDFWMRMLTEQVNLPDSEKGSFAMILEVNGQPAGHCNVNEITFGRDAKMHLHVWSSGIRQKGLGTSMVLQSLPIFFDRLKLEVVYCEPYALNPAPNRTLQNIGFEFVKTYRTIPGFLNFEQEVNRYRLTREQFEQVKKNSQGSGSQ